MDHKTLGQIIGAWDEGETDWAVELLFTEGINMRPWMTEELMRARPDLGKRVFWEAQKYKKEAERRDLVELVRERNYFKELVELKNQDLERVGGLWLKERALREESDKHNRRMYREVLEENNRLREQKRAFEAEVVRLKEYIFQQFRNV